MKSKLFYSQFFGLLLIFLLILLVVPIYTKVIPNKLKQRIENVLEKENLDWVAVRVENRDVVLSGLAPTFEDNKQALWLTKKVKGIRIIENKISPMLISPYSMDISYDSKTIILKGYMPTKERKAILLAKVTQLYGKKFVDKIDIGAGEPKAWNDFILTVAKELKKFDLSSVHISDNVVHISGKIGTEKERIAVEQKLRAFEKKDFEINCHMVALDASAKVCQEKFNTLLRKEKIKFQSNKSFIKASNHKLLESLSDISLLCPSVSIEIIGYTDSLGNDSKNEALSLSRAKSVVAKLFTLGIPLERLSAKGMGEQNPIASNETKEGRAKNRRIEFKVIQKRGK